MKYGTLGTVKIVLPVRDIGGQAYTRTYKPVTPASRTVTGSDDAIAPETDIATWTITDWSGGEGDVRWRDNGRFNTSDGCGPASDGSGVTVGAKWTYASGQTKEIARCGGELVAAREGNDDLYNWNGSAWVSIGGIGDATASDILSIGAVDNNIWFVIENGSDFRKVESTGNSLYYSPPASAWEMTAFNGVLYYITKQDLLWLNRTTAASTKVYDESGSSVYQVNRVKRLSKSDKGPVWYTEFNDGTTILHEYNHADDVAYVIGELPRDVTAYDVAFHNGIYLVVYRDADEHASVGDAYLWYKIGRNGASGVAGPFRNTQASTASDSIAIAGVIGDRIMVVYQERLWGYDLSTGGVSMIADCSSSAFGQVRSAVTFGSDVIAGSNNGYVQIETQSYQTSTAQTLSTGWHNYGYLGLAKLVHTVTVSLEAALAASGTVEVGYATDGSAVTWLSNDFATGEAAHTWTVSTSTGTSVKGTELEWSLRLTTTDSAVTPKVIAITSDVSGAKARIEWIVAVDVGESSVTDGDDVISALNALKTSHAVVSWSDPFQVDGYTTDQTFDVRVLDVATPELRDDGHLFATVKFQTVGTVG